MNKKNGFSHYIVLECVDTECDWKHCFHCSQKQGPSYTLNTRAVLVFRKIGEKHSAMTTFAAVMNIQLPATCRNFTKILNNKLLKQLASDSMMTIQ